MPGYDGTGPTGRGAMTGHGGGYCISEWSERRRPLGLGRGGRPFGGGRGRCFGGRYAGHRMIDEVEKTRNGSEDDE